MKTSKILIAAMVVGILVLVAIYFAPTLKGLVAKPASDTTPAEDDTYGCAGSSLVKGGFVSLQECMKGKEAQMKAESDAQAQADAQKKADAQKQHRTVFNALVTGGLGNVGDALGIKLFN